MSEKIPIWRIKYFPKTLEQVCGRNGIKERLGQILLKKNFPHLLFVGAEGIGKTTIASLFAQEFLGDFYDANSKIVYADLPLTEEERSLARSEAYVSKSRIGSIAGSKITMPAFIQVKVKPFVQLKAIGEVPFKILIVKNFEALGNNQQGFRRLMETYGRNCRMILITTKISGVIDPIVSRCQIFLISSTDFESFKNLILHVADQESLLIEEETIEVLYKVTRGKLAHAIDLLQLCSVSGKEVNIDKIYENSLDPKSDSFKALILMGLKGDFPKARELSRKIQTEYKYGIREILINLTREIEKLPLSMYTRSKLYNLIADADFRAIYGRDVDIQISALLSKISYLSSFL